MNHPAPIATGDRETTRLAWIALALIIIAGGILRLRGLDAVGLWLDEILAVLRSEASPLSTSWTPGTDPQHGPLYHGLLALSGFFAPNESGYRFPFALAGTLCLPVLYLLARRVTTVGVSLLTVGLVASSPLHVFESQDARPYTILVLLLLTGLYAIVRLANDARATRWYAAYLATLALLLLASSQSFWFTVILLAGYALVLLARWRSVGTTHVIVRLGAAVALLLVLFPGLYGPLIVHQPDVIGPPPFSLDFVGRMFQPLVSGYSEQQPVIGWIIFPALALAAIGAVVTLRRQPLEGGVVGLSLVFGFALPMMALYTVGHGVRARYTIAALPALTLFIAAGVLWLAAPLGSLARRFAEGRASVALAVTGLVTVVVWQAQQPMIAQAFASRANWRSVAKLIADRAQAGDLVLTSNAWAQVCLNFYFPRMGLRFDVQSADESVDRARQLADARKIAFLVSGGWHASQDVPRWMGQFPELYSSHNESIGVTFYPDRATAMVQRPPRTQLARDEHWLWTSLSGALIPDENGARFLLDGWSPLEIGSDRKGFRWVDGQQASAYVPVVKQHPTALTFDAKAFAAIADAQQVTVLVNGAVVFTTELAREWQHVEVNLSDAPWRYGSNQLELQFSAAKRPSDITPGSPDGRNLSAAFQTLDLD
jgi:4-amino-4-deoxy-L-arabinose transferase-like glycosyltransferase